MSVPFGYVPVEQRTKEMADYARKGIARGRPRAMPLRANSAFSLVACSGGT